MWVRFLKDTGPNKANSFADIDDSTANVLIQMGQVEKTSEDPVERAVAMAAAQFSAVIEARSSQPPATPPATPPARLPATQPRTLVERDRGEVEFQHLRGGISEADRRRSQFSFFIRDIIHANPQNPDPDDRAAAHERLVKPWDEGGFGSQLRAMVEGTGTAGGYVTPVVFETLVMEVMAEQEVIIPWADQKPLAAREVSYPVLNQFSIPVAGQSAMFGGIKVYRKGETQQRTESDMSFKRIGMVAGDMTAYTELSRDLVQDAPGVDNYVIRAFGSALGWREDWESINGNGDGMFLGFLNAPCTLVLVRNTSAHIKYQDIFTMKTRLRQQAGMNTAWIAHPYTLYDIETLQDPSGKFIYQPNTFVAQGAPGATMVAGSIQYALSGYLLGWPLLTSEKVPALGTTGDLSLLNRKSYWIGRRSGLEIGTSEHFRFDTDELALRAKIRNDGKPGQIAPYYLADGSGTNQVSDFVTLSSATS